MSDRGFLFLFSIVMIVGCLASEAIAEALAETQEDAETLEESLFAVVAAALRKLKPLRKHLPALLETACA